MDVLTLYVEQSFRLSVVTLRRSITGLGLRTITEKQLHLRVNFHGLQPGKDV